MQREELKDLSRKKVEYLLCEWRVKYHELKELKDCNEKLIADL